MDHLKPSEKDISEVILRVLGTLIVLIYNPKLYILYSSFSNKKALFFVFYVQEIKNITKGKKSINSF